MFSHWTNSAGFPKSKRARGKPPSPKSSPPESDPPIEDKPPKMSDSNTGTEKKSAIDGSVLAHMFESRDFADVTVFVGATAFHLHRSVLCSSSGFFKTACKTDTFKEGITREIHLPEIDVATFERVIAWQYEQGYDIPWSSGHSDFLMFQAADYLQIQSLRQEVLKHLAKVCETKLCELRRDSEEFVMEELLDNFSKMCEIGHKSELELLSDIAKSIACHWDIDVEGLLDTLNDGTYGNIFLAVMLGVHRSSRCESEALKLSFMMVLRGGSKANGYVIFQ
ncbi:hypothetical protein TWF106_007413 [Orbilia oligospora]|uniref:BTB domain-containing protein n=1 Tax=Orbilia oligospora TaxID=2813651 RepID=A0A7C8V3H5_ORBOL|nr:hypothetical protein TWF106_007413 [Orbilia oligospora]